MSRQGWPTNSE